MKLLLASLLALLWLTPSLAAKQIRRWNRFQLEEDKPRRKLSTGKGSGKGGVRGEMKQEDATSTSKTKKKLAKKHKCNRDRRAVEISTVFDANTLNPVGASGVVGVEFGFEGEYTGTWTQTSIEVTDEIVLGHDHLTFFDADGEMVGALTTQYDGTVDNFAVVTAGFGEFSCAQGSPTMLIPDDSSPMVTVVWNLCVCYH